MKTVARLYDGSRLCIVSSQYVKNRIRDIGSRARKRSISAIFRCRITQSKTTVTALVLGLRHDVEETRLKHGDH
jgi:hypothetical protein